MRRSTYLALPVLAGLAGAVPLLAVAGPWTETKEAKLRLVSRYASAVPAGDAGLGLEFELAPGWHVYWKNAGDAGYPPLLELEAGTLASSQLLFPAPERYDLPGGLVAFGYEREVIYPIDARLAPQVPNPAPIAGDLDYLVCAESCIPYKVRLTLELPVGDGADSTEDPLLAPRVDQARLRLPAPAPAGATARLAAGEGETLLLELTFAVPGIRVGAPDLFFEPHPLVDLGRPMPLATAAGPGFRVSLRPLDETKPLPDRLRFAWTATGFELDGKPVAWEGVSELERPTHAALPAIGRPASIVLVLIVLTVVLAFALKRRHRISPT
jgi:DsbC/DsbD-like thiol-disulfide interchange protein